MTDAILCDWRIINAAAAETVTVNRVRRQPSPKSHGKDVTAAPAHTPEARQTHSERPHITRPATNTRHGPWQIEPTSPPARNAASVSLYGMTPFDLRPGRVVVHFTPHGTVARG